MTDLSNRTTVPQQVAERAQVEPDGVAVTNAATGATLTWAELDRNARRWAAAFASLGVQPGEPVVHIMVNSFESMFTWLGLTWLKAFEAPLSGQLRGEWLVDGIKASNPRVVLLCPQAVEAFAEVAHLLPGIEHVVVLEETERLPEAKTMESLLAGVEPVGTSDPPQYWDVGCAIYTSGTTGPPKLALVSWGLLMNGPRTMFAPDVFEGMVFYSATAPCHSANKTGLVAALSKNGSLVIREAFSASRFWDDFRKFNCTSMMMPATVASMLLAQPERPDDADNPMHAIYMGPAIADVDRFRERFGVPHISTCYGSTESGGVLINPTVVSGAYSNCGRPHAVTGPLVQLVDEHDLPVAPGELGELVMRPQIPWTTFQGYLGRDDVAVKAWRNGWLHSGDIFRQNAAGEYVFVDRIAGRLRRRGHNVAASEIERQINAHESVRECAVIPVPSPLGEDDIHAIVVLEPSAVLPHQELSAFLVERLPKYARPRYIEFIDELPRTEGMLRVSIGELKSRGVAAGAWDVESQAWVA